MSVPLVCEFPIYLRRFKFLRVLSFVTAIVYSSVTIFIFATWLIDLYVVPEYVAEEDFDKISILDVFVNMCMIYNTILHISIVPINAMIFAKEFQL